MYVTLFAGGIIYGNSNPTVSALATAIIIITNIFVCLMFLFMVVKAIHSCRTTPISRGSQCRR